MKAFFLVLGTVVLGLISATLLKEATLNESAGGVYILVILLLVSIVNGARFFVWGTVHKHYPLSQSYPLSSMFFPLLLLLSYMYGESVQAKEVLGALLITVGVILLTLQSSVGNK